MESNNLLIKENSELRKAAREQLRGKWGACILLCLIFSLITATLSCTYYLGTIGYIGGSILSLIIVGPLTLGLVSSFLKLVRNETFRIENLFDGFSNFSSAFVLQLLISLFTFLWTLLFVIPGIIAYYRYSMAFYILSDNPNLSASEALERSKQMMKGYKGKLFCLYLSFIGWSILATLTLGIGYLWLIPYMNTSVANFYQNLKDASLGSSNAENTDGTINFIES